MTEKRRGRKEKQTPYVNTPRHRLALELREARRAAGIDFKTWAEGSGWTPGHLSSVETGGTMPSRALVEWYENRLGGDGLYLSLYEAAIFEEDRKRQPQRQVVETDEFVLADPDPLEDVSRIPGDRVSFIDETIPDNTILRPGEEFTKTWTIQNAGKVVWCDRYLTLLGPTTGPGSIYAPRQVKLPTLINPGERITIEVLMRAQRGESTAHATYKMTDRHGTQYFPRTYMIGLGVTIITRRQHRPRAR
jgi:transcriptional regulator with XRE-family HTH domain